MTDFLGTPPRVISLGLDLFAQELERLGIPVVQVAWSPPAGGDPRLAGLLERLQSRAAAIETANAEVVSRLVGGEPLLVDCRPAWEAIELPEHVVLHAGPPLAWARMCEPLQAAVLCAIRYEEWAANDDAARHLVESGRVRLEPCHHWRAVGPMTGMITRSMPVFVVENRAHGNRAHVTINEGLGKVLRFGANDESVLARLRWMATEAGPLLGAALRAAGGLPLRPLMAQAVRMGDEMHQRNLAASALLARAIMPHAARAGGRHHAVARLAEFIAGNDQFFLNVAMAAGKAIADPAGVPGSTVVTTMARNGTEFGIRVAALGERWLTAPVEMPVGLYFPGYGPDDANPDMGDSAIVETIGLGGLAMAASPAVARFVGAGGMAQAVGATESMREITVAEHAHFRIPALDDRGTPVGIDVRRVVETGITPLINTGIAGRKAGVGQVGAGVARAPIGCFTAALQALVELRS
ncbi:MAG TPA: DUF1116 domain-containing protein [Methylomirabilota bacterium]|jgi:hypothetical protein|nr:DUF1116 domain-containing protein [Methylomirabilota bacterium]